MFHVGDCAHLPRRRQRARAADRRPPGRVSSRAELPGPRARRATAASRSTTGARPSSAGDVFVLATDGVYEHVDARVRSPTRSRARARRPGRGGPRRSSTRRCGRAAPTTSPCSSCASTRCRRGDAGELLGRADGAAAAAAARSRGWCFDGYRIVRELHASSRSHVYLAVDADSGAPVVAQDAVDRPARRPRLPRALHDGGMDRAAHRQRRTSSRPARRQRARAASSTSPWSTSRARRWRNG